MKIDLEPHPPVVTLEEPEDTKKFHVTVVGGKDWGLVFGALVDAAAGRLEAEEAFITIDAVRRLAKDRVGDIWEADFTAMLDYARTKGWFDEGGNAICAHLEWAEATS
ncbi:MAG: hypothetical protein WD598_17295 [Acidimicrobiia bacterium]